MEEEEAHVPDDDPGDAFHGAIVQVVVDGIQLCR